MISAAEARIQSTAQRGARELVREIAAVGLPVAETVEHVLAISNSTPLDAVGPLRPFVLSVRCLVAALHVPHDPLELVERAVASAIRAAAGL
jgi:hypothetical protein